MNFLAHLYLSGESEDLLVGNFIGDWIKGNNYDNFPQTIKEGILLHRYIDEYTDKHPITSRLRNKLNPEYVHYSGVIVDIFYDHFLSVNWQEFSAVPLHDFIKNSFRKLNNNVYKLPKDARRSLFWLKRKKRLESYSKIKGIRNTLKAMSIYTSLPDKTDFAMQVLMENYTIFNLEFKYFMEDIIGYISTRFAIELPDVSIGNGQEAEQ